MAEPELMKVAMTKRLADLAAKLVNKKGIPAAEVAEAFVNLGLALVLKAGTSPLECALALRERANRLEELEARGAPEGPSLN
jgi:hypothetical protein